MSAGKGVAGRAEADIGGLPRLGIALELTSRYMRHFEIPASLGVRLS